MPTWYTAKKRSKWWNAYLRISMTSSTRNLKFGGKSRRSYAKRDRIYKNFDKWRCRNEIFGWDFGHPALFYFDKRQRCKVFEYLDKGFESDFPPSDEDYD